MEAGVGGLEPAFEAQGGATRDTDPEAFKPMICSIPHLHLHHQSPGPASVLARFKQYRMAMMGLCSGGGAPSWPLAVAEEWFSAHTSGLEMF